MQLIFKKLNFFFKKKIFYYFDKFFFIFNIYNSSLFQRINLLIIGFSVVFIIIIIRLITIVNITNLLYIKKQYNNRCFSDIMR